MGYECEGCGATLLDKDYKRVASYTTEKGKVELIFCSGNTWPGSKQNNWCLENTLAMMLLSLDEETLNSITDVEILKQVTVAREFAEIGKYDSLNQLKQELQTNSNDRELFALNKLNATRLAEGDYLISSPWVFGLASEQPEYTKPRAIKKRDADPILTK